MKTKLLIVFAFGLLISIVANIYLFTEKNKWKEAWLNQFIATNDLEAIFKSSTDLTFDNIRRTSIEKFGEKNVKVVNLENALAGYGADNLALGVNDTLIIFKNGSYFGSLAK